MKQSLARFAMQATFLCLLGLSVLLYCSSGCKSPATKTKEPQTYIKVEAKSSPKDKEWKTYETRTLDMVPGFKPYARQVKLDQYGGRTDMKAKATGFFYPKKVGDRWWLVDPEGNLFIHVAIVGVYLGLTDFDKQYSIKHFGTEEVWAQFAAELLHKYSFNGSAGWSRANLLRKTKYPPVYTLSWDFMADFAGTKNLSWQVSGHKGYPDEVWPVFHPDFPAFCDEYAKKLAATKDDPYCLGHFSDN
jgi:hypothetical protein